VIWRSGKLQFDSTAGRLLHYLEAVSSIVAGVISGFLASLAVKSALILGTLTERADRANIILLIAAMASGWGERLATSIISTVQATKLTGVDGGDDKSDSEDTDDKGKSPKPAPKATDQGKRARPVAA